MKTVGVFWNINFEKRKSKVSPLSTRNQAPAVLDIIKCASDPQFLALQRPVSRKCR